jgi:hypothetical protein
MLSRTLTVACLTIVFVASGCDSKPTHESMAKDMIGKLKEGVEILKDVKDEASAKAAKPKLEALKKEIDAMEIEAEKLPKASAEEEKRLEEKYKPELDKVRTEFTTEIIRIGSDPKLIAELGSAIR